MTSKARICFFDKVSRVICFLVGFLICQVGLIFVLSKKGFPSIGIIVFGLILISILIEGFSGIKKISLGLRELEKKKYFLLVLILIFYISELFYGKKSEIVPLSRPIVMILFTTLWLRILEEDKKKIVFSGYFSFSLLMAICGLIVFAIFFINPNVLYEFNLTNYTGGKFPRDIGINLYKTYLGLGLVLTGSENYNIFGIDFYRGSGWTPEPFWACIFILPAITKNIFDIVHRRNLLKAFLSSIIFLSFILTCISVAFLICLATVVFIQLLNAREGKLIIIAFMAFLFFLNLSITVNKKRSDSRNYFESKLFFDPTTTVSLRFISSFYENKKWIDRGFTGTKYSVDDPKNSYTDVGKLSIFLVFIILATIVYIGYFEILYEKNIFYFSIVLSLLLIGLKGNFSNIISSNLFITFFSYYLSKRNYN